MQRKNKNLLIVNVLAVFILNVIQISCLPESKNDSFNVSYYRDLLSQYPDSTLNLLTGKIQDSSWSIKDRIEYQLLILEAKDKTGQSLIINDSILDVIIDQSLKIKNDYLLAKAYIYKGKLWAELKEPEKAINLYHKSLDIIKNKKHSSLEIKNHNELGNIFLSQDLYPEAINEFNKSLQYSTQANDTSNICRSIRNIGIAFLYLNNLDSVYYYINKAFRYSMITKDSLELTTALLNDLSIYYSETENYKEALRCLKSIKKPDAKVALNKGILYYSLENYDSARHYLSLCSNNNDIWVETSANYYLFCIEEKLNRFKEANIYLNKYMEGSDSINLLTKTSDIFAIQHKHNIKTTVNALKNHHEKSTIIGTSIALFFILTIAATSIYYNKKKKMTLLEKDAKISLLINQIAEKKKTINQLYEQKNAFNQIIQSKEGDLNTMLILRDKLFFNNPVIQQVKKLAQSKDIKKGLSQSERKELERLLNLAYFDYIEEYTTKCSLLTMEDVYFCCLARLKFTLIEQGIVFGYIGTHNTRQRKYRIKNKMIKGSDNNDLFYSIFNE